MQLLEKLGELSLYYINQIGRMGIFLVLVCINIVKPPYYKISYVTKQIDALECMAIDPHNYIMAPKFIAAIISMPLLTAIFYVVGIFGGYLIGVVQLGANEGAYFHSMYKNDEGLFNLQLSFSGAGHTHHGSRRKGR